MSKRNGGELSVSVLVVCVVLLLCGAVAYKEYGKWKKKADAQQAIVFAAEAAKAKTIADAAAYESAKAAYKAGALALKPGLDEFSDALQVAKSTGRMALATPVLRMQKAYRQFQNFQTSACLSKGKESAEKYMEYTILGFTEFMSESGSEIRMSSVHFKRAADADQRSAQEFEGCAPKPPQIQGPSQ